MASSARASLNPSPDVAPVTDRLYQPTRVLISVLFTPQAATSISTPSPPGLGTGTSARTSSISGPPVPTSTAARIIAGGRHPGRRIGLSLISLPPLHPIRQDMSSRYDVDR